IDFVLSPKGDGSILASVPTSGVSDKRGLRSVDLQQTRTSSNQVARGNYSVISGGSSNRITSSGNYGVVNGGQLNSVNATYGSIVGGGLNEVNGSFGFIGGGEDNTVGGVWSTIGGGNYNLTSANWATVSGGLDNMAKSNYTTVSGGAGNYSIGEGTAIFGGVELYLDSTAGNSFGYNGNKVEYVPTNFPPGNYYTRRMRISTPRTGVFNNVDLWITNNDDSVRTLRFYEKYNQQGNFPNGTNYVAFRAPNSLASDVTYTLPSAAPVANGQVLSSTTGGVLSWVNGGGNINDYFEFNDLNPGNNSSIQAHLMTPYGQESDIDVVIMPKGKASFMLDYPDNQPSGGAKRGIHSVDLQLLRNTQQQVVKADTAVILGGFANEISNNAHTSVIIGGALNSASAYQSTILGGRSNTASGQFSLVGGLGNTSGSYGETVFGYYATETGGTTSSAVSTDRLFAIGNGTSAARSTAFSILKNGNTNIAGTLDVNNNLSVGGGSSTSELRLKEASGTGSNFVGLKAGNVTADQVYTLPTSAPTTNGQFLVSTTGGTMSWNTPIVKAQNINVDPGNLFEYGGSESIAVTVTGAQVGGTVQVSPRAEMETGIIIGYARVTAADTVSIRFVNTTNAPVDPAAVNVDITVIQP
ncbi:MAG: hypothetical protein ACKOFB_07900, partial [bacterium]